MELKYTLHFRSVTTNQEILEKCISLITFIIWQQDVRIFIIYSSIKIRLYVHVENWYSKDY